MGAPATVSDAVGTPTFTYDEGASGTLQLTAEAMTGIINKTITRSYSTAVPMIGRPTGLSTGSEYTVGYAYDAHGRLNNVTGPGLPAGGAAYSFLADSNQVETTSFMASGSTAVATATCSFEA